MITFEIGGDSILSIQIVSRAKQAGLQLTPKQLFEHQTIAELAQVVKEEQGVQAEQGIIIGETILTPIQQRFLRKIILTHIIESIHVLQNEREIGHRITGKGGR